MTYEVKLEIFEGPLDLLLHLIHKNEVSIIDIPIALITAQFLGAIDLMKSLNLDVAGEYLVMAAYLTHIKSQMLIPVDEHEDEADMQNDPRSELVTHLLEYKRFKEAAELLDQRTRLDRDTFVRENTDENLFEPLESLDVSLNDLLSAFKTMLARSSRPDLLEMQPEQLSVKDKINEILELLKSTDYLSFDSLFENDLSRVNIVTTFLAILELAKLQLIRVYQDAPYGKILISGQSSAN
jgi:segregation and condensation protein A